MLLIPFKNMSAGKVGIYTYQRIWLVSGRWAQCRDFLSILHFSFHYTVGSFSYALAQIMSFCVTIFYLSEVKPMSGTIVMVLSFIIFTFTSQFLGELKSRDVYVNLNFERLC